MHKTGMVHLDVKPENGAYFSNFAWLTCSVIVHDYVYTLGTNNKMDFRFLDGGTVVLTDFGLTSLDKEKEGGPNAGGSKNYMWPKMLKQGKYDCQLVCACEMCSDSL